MTETAFPFDAGAGANITEDQWSKMAQMWAGSGPSMGELSELLPFGDSTGMQVKLSPGRAYIRGHFYENDATLALAVGANGSGNPRIDRLVVRLNKTTNTANAMILAGTPAASPVGPALTQSATVWDIPIANITVGNGAATITAANVADIRELQTSPTGLWKPFVPTWTANTAPSVGNGSLVGAYRRQGNTIQFRIILTWGTTSAPGVGAWQFGMPVGAAAVAPFVALVSKAAGGSYEGVTQMSGASLYVLVPSSATSTSLNYVQSNIPAGLWGSGDSIQITGTYEALPVT